MLEHHRAWLSAHPERTERWLNERLLDGFDVHHLDGNHMNNRPDNLVLVEHMDHLRCLHGKPGNRLVAVSVSATKRVNRHVQRARATKWKAEKRRRQGERLARVAFLD